MQYSERDNKGYPLFFFHPSNQWKLSLLVSLTILAISAGFFVWATHVSDDMGGDSFAGLVFAVASTTFMFLAAVSFSLRRRSPQRSVGTLNAVLNWHACFGVISLVMVFLHAFGNYNPRTGTYALYAMIALVISGFIGRFLDRVMPRLMAQRVRKALTPRGEDRIESVVNKMQSAIMTDKQRQRTFQTAQSGVSGRQGILQTGWDTAYTSLGEVSQEMARYGGQYRQEPMRAIKEVQQALKQEMFLRYVIRYWRIFHIILAVVTVGLTLWHIEYALALVIPALEKYGFGYLLPWP
jgi:hypothetical protein